MSGHPSLLQDARPRLLDLFCGAGGASRGYHDAGFAVLGVDIKPQPRYPFPFVQMDAPAYLRAGIADGYIHEFDAIHASPPCQRYSDLAKRNGNADAHPDLIGPVRDLLRQTGLPYVIENVEGAPLRNPLVVCGTSLGLGVDGYRLRRHRLFETNASGTTFFGVCDCAQNPSPVIDVSGGGPTKAPRLDGKGGRTYKGTADQARAAMGIDWMTKRELNEAIPPAYTGKVIGPMLMKHIQRAMAAVA